MSKQRGAIKAIGSTVVQDGLLWATDWVIDGGDYPGNSLTHGLSGWTVEDLKVIADVSKQFGEGSALGFAEGLRGRPSGS